LFLQVTAWIIAITEKMFITVGFTTIVLPLLVILHHKITPDFVEYIIQFLSIILILYLLLPGLLKDTFSTAQCQMAG
jgi:hypothetical protein